jgi:hypothetical protein
MMYCGQFGEWFVSILLFIFLLRQDGKFPLSPMKRQLLNGNPIMMSLTDLQGLYQAEFEW